MLLSVLQPQPVVRYAYLHLVTSLLYLTVSQKRKIYGVMFCEIVFCSISQGVTVHKKRSIVEMVMCWETDNDDNFQAFPFKF